MHVISRNNVRFICSHQSPYSCSVSFIVGARGLVRLVSQGSTSKKVDGSGMYPLPSSDKDHYNCNQDDCSNAC